jgi:hypothetical protein
MVGWIPPRWRRILRQVLLGIFPRNRVHPDSHGRVSRAHLAGFSLFLCRFFCTEAGTLIASPSATFH